MNQGPSIQERLYPASTCFGCGPANPGGLHLASFDGDDGLVAQFTPWPAHDNGMGFLNGGIIATVLDCHSGAVAIHLADQRGWRPAPGALYQYVTAGLDVQYLRPAPLTEPCDLRGWVVEPGEDEVTVVCELWWDEKVRARSSSQWRSWRPRPSTS